MSEEYKENAERLFLVPASGVHSGVSDVLYTIADYIRQKFPNNFFKSYHYNTKDGFYSQYFKIKDSILKGRNMEFTQQKKPRLVIIYDDRTNSTKETGLGDVSPFKYPMSQGVHPDMHEYDIFYKDENGIELYTNDKRVRVNFEVIAEAASASDQEDILSYFENTIKIQYGIDIQGARAKFILPNSLIAFLRKTLYFGNILSASQVENEELKKELFNEINTSFANYIEKFSNKGIIRGERENLQGKDTFFMLDRIYNHVYMQIESPPEKTDGEKKGEVYDKFTVQMNGFLEYYKPLTYLLKTPDVVCGHLIDDIVQVSSEVDKFLQDTPTGTLPYHLKPNIIPEHIIRETKSGDWEIMYKEKDFMVDTPKDYINIYEWLEDEKWEGKYKEIINYMKTLNTAEIKKRFEFFIYAGDTMKDSLDIMYENGLLYMTNTDSTKLHTLYILYYRKEVEYQINFMLNKESNQ